MTCHLSWYGLKIVDDHSGVSWFVCVASLGESLLLQVIIVIEGVHIVCEIKPFCTSRCNIEFFRSLNNYFIQPNLRQFGVGGGGGGIKQIMRAH